MPSSHDYNKSPFSLRYIYSKYELNTLQETIDEEIQTLCNNYFRCKVVHLDTNWTPHINCNSCRLMLNWWENKKK